MPDDNRDHAVHVRSAVASDAPVIADYNLALAAETEALRLDPAVVLRGVERILGDASKGRYFVAEVAAGRVVGCLMITFEWSDWRDANLWWFQSVYVHLKWRRRGVFRALYEHVQRAAINEGVYGLRLYVEQENRDAQRTYESLGMTRARYLVMETMPLTATASARGP